MTNKTAAIILAAGKGTRMKSNRPKVLHPIANKPMVGHVQDTAKRAGCSPIVIVTADDMEQVRANTSARQTDCLHAIQTSQDGTADAVRAAHPVLKDHDCNLLVLFGDSPLIRPETIEAMQNRLSKDAELAVVALGFQLENPPAYGRLVLNAQDELERIVETKDASPEELAIEWCNAGVMLIRGNLAWSLLEQVGNDNAQGEYYLPDIIELARNAGYRCAVVEGQHEEALGVNSRAELAQVEALMQHRLRANAMAQGATLIDPDTVFLSADTQLGQDVTIQPNVFFGPEVVVGNHVEIRAFSHIEGTVIADHAMIGPFARLRPGTHIGEDCKIGNFVELKKAQVEKGAKISHLSYVGDATVGEEANLGAGTITCNYDGYRKYHTEIGRDVFIGSNSALVAPVTIGDGAMVGAGSVVTENVAADSLALARSRQTHKEQWAKAFRNKEDKSA